MNASLLTSLIDRVAADPAAPSAMHPGAWPLGERVAAWARGRGLVLGDPDTSPLGRARCERLAARVFPAAELDGVELFARWLTWTFALDDAVDEPPLAGSATAVDGLYEELLRAVRRGHARPGARPLEGTLVELWGATAPGMSRAWRRRFMTHMEEHRAGCTQEAVNRRTGETPTLEGYPALRRRACGPFLYDLVEPVLGVELPDHLTTTPAWKDLIEGTADMIAWSNDVASYAKEAAGGDVHNQVAVLATAYGFRPEQAARWVADHVALRIGDVRAAARAMPETFDRLGSTAEERAAAAQVVRVLMDAPRAHLEWLVESGRYSVAASLTPLGPGQEADRLDGLASLR